MKLLLTALVGLAALQACVAEDVKVTATATNLDDEEKGIVNGLLRLITGVIEAGGDIDQMQDVLADIKVRVEKKLQVNGAPYLNKMAETLSNVHIPDDSVDAILRSIASMAEKDGVSLGSRSSRSKRSPKKKFKKKGKMGKMGKKGKKGCGK